jgi:hypothetical protein
MKNEIKRMYKEKQRLNKEHLALYLQNPNGWVIFGMALNVT